MIEEAKPIRCTYCGGKLVIAYAYEGNREVSGFECFDWLTCGASWNASGDVAAHGKGINPEGDKK